MASQLLAAPPAPAATMMICSKKPLEFVSSRHFPWEANVEIVAPRVFISQNAVLSTQPGKTLSFTCNEGFACLGKMQAVKTKIVAFEVFMGRSHYLNRRIHRLSKEEAKQQFSSSNSAQQIIILTLPAPLYYLGSDDFETKFPAFRSHIPWARLSLFPEERLPLYRQIIDQVTVDLFQRKRVLEAPVNCGAAVRHRKRRR